MPQWLQPYLAPLLMLMLMLLMLMAERAQRCCHGRLWRNLNVDPLLLLRRRRLKQQWPFDKLLYHFGKW